MLFRSGLFYPITDGRSAPLQLRLQAEGQLIGFYREDTNERLLIPGELAQALQQESLARQQAEQRAEQAEARLAELQAQLKAQGIKLDEDIES